MATIAAHQTDGSAWIEGGNCKGRVVRGGSWYYSPPSLRSAYRLNYSFVFTDSYLGFRVARTLLAP